MQEISKELLSLSSSLMSMGAHPPPSSPCYWHKEIQLVKQRKDSGAPVWQAHSDVAIIKQLLADCTMQLPRASAFVQDAMILAFGQPPSHAVLHSCRIKNAKR